MRVILRGLPLLTALLVLGEQTLAQQDSFDRVVSQYEERMQRAARSWLRKNYARALDGFYSAREVLSENMPLTKDDFAWAEWCALKTYTVVLARLVEADLYRSQGRSDMVNDVTEQALEWVEILKEQAYEWGKVKTYTPAEKSLRKHWMERFLTTVRQAERISSGVKQEE